MSKTIKELADELGVSKTAVRKYMTEEFRHVYTQTDRNGVITIDSAGCKLIAEYMGRSEKLSETTENKFSETPESSENPLYSILREELAAKNKQIDEKDRLIEQLRKDLADERQHSHGLAAELAKLADQAQHLHAGSIKKQLGAGEPESQDEVTVDAEPEQKKHRRGFFAWLDQRR